MAKSIPLLVSGEGELLFRADGTAKAFGYITQGRKFRKIQMDDIHWEHCQGNRFKGAYQDLHFDYYLSDMTLKTTINPYQMRIVNNRGYDITIPIEMERQA